MARTILALGALAFLCYAYVGLSGTFDPLGSLTQRGLLANLGSSLFVLFAQFWMVLYLLGTGRGARSLTTERGWEEDPAVLAGEGLRRRLFPWAAASIVMVVACFAVVAVVFAGLLPEWTYRLFFWLALAAQAIALVVELRVLEENERQLAALDRRLEAGAAGADSAS